MLKAYEVSERKENAIMTLEQISQWMTIVAGIAAVLGLVWAGSKIVKKSRLQNQRVEGKSVGVQSGRDTKIEINDEQAGPRGRK